MVFKINRTVSSQLELIEGHLATMGGLVEQQVADAITAFERADLQLAERTRARDAEVDEYEMRIELEVVRILDDRRPGGASLRRLMMAIKIAAEMERIGDLSKNVAKRVSVLSGMEDTETVRKVVPSVVRMGQRALGQVSESLDALYRDNAAAAEAVRESDGQIDELYNSIFREILLAMDQNGAGVAYGTHMMFVAKNFERIGDHATNIAERVHYALTGHLFAEERMKTDRTSTAGMPKG